MNSTASLPAGGHELACRIAAVNDELLALARAAQAARETELSNVLHILARGLTDTSVVRQYLNLYNAPTKE